MLRSLSRLPPVVRPASRSAATSSSCCCRSSATRTERVVVPDDIRAQLAAPYLVDGVEITLTVSLGIAMHSVDAYSYADLVRVSDRAMYRDKARRPAAPSIQGATLVSLLGSDQAARKPGIINEPRNAGSPRSSRQPPTTLSGTRRADSRNASNRRVPKGRSIARARAPSSLGGRGRRSS